MALESRRHYPTIAAYTADVIKARNAYAADMAAQDGRCTVCGNKADVDRRHRRCATCRRTRRTEPGSPT